MRIGVPTEVQDGEFRVALTPAGVHQLTQAGHYVVMEANCGIGAGLYDDEYEIAGAEMHTDPAQVWSADLVLKVKDPVPEEFGYLTKNQILFTFLHLAAHEDLTRALLDAGTTAIAYEDVVLPDGTRPILSPMSEVAGRLAPQVGAYHLMMPQGGAGTLLGGVPGAPRAKVVVIGGGVAGQNAAAIALGMRAKVTVLDIDLQRLRHLDDLFDGNVRTIYATEYDIARQTSDADLVIGAVLNPGARAPKVMTADMVRRLKAGAVLVDIAIDQGGCIEGSHLTTHSAPTYLVGDKVFYSVGNMPGGVPATSTNALTAATLPYVSAVANKGWQQAMRDDAALHAGLVTHRGKLYGSGVAEAHGLELSDAAGALESEAESASEAAKTER